MSLHVWRHPKPIGALGLCLGRTDLPVDRRRAKRLAHRMRAHARHHLLARHVVTSRLQRSAAVGRVLAHWGWRHTVDARLDEFDFGAWDGKPWAGLARDEIETWGRDFVDHHAGGGESVRTLLLRCRAFMAEQDDCCIVGHAGWISAACWLQVHSHEMPRASTWPTAVGYGCHVALG